MDELDHSTPLITTLCLLADRGWREACSSSLTSMGRVGNVDVKLFFAEYSGVPGPGARDFKKSCAQKLGQPVKEIRFFCLLTSWLLTSWLRWLVC